MEGVQDITKVNRMISELKKHNIGMTSDTAYDRAQAMMLGRPLTDENMLTPVEQDVRSMGFRMDALTQNVVELQKQVIALQGRLQDAISLAVAAQETASRRVVQSAPAPPQAASAAPRNDAQKKSGGDRRSDDGYDVSVENIFYYGKK